MSVFETNGIAFQKLLENLPQGQVKKVFDKFATFEEDAIIAFFKNVNRKHGTINGTNLFDKFDELDADILANVGNISSDTVVFNADWDTNQELAKEYAVPKYHTVSYLSKDGLEKNITGLFTLADLVKEF